jgi:hypothetical protein
MAAGWLTLDEFQERLDAAYEAKTLGQLDEITADLPAIDLYRLPEATMRQAQATGGAGLIAPSPHGRLSPAWRGAWSSWASVTLLLFVIWLITAVSSHHADGLWFLWIAGPWGAILLGRWMFGHHPGGSSSGGPGHIQTGQANELRSGERQQRLDEQLQRHQEQMQHHQEQMRRQQERMQRRYRPPDGGSGSPGEY